MGTKLPEGVKRKDLLMVPVELITVDDGDNYTRGTRGSIEDLALSIATEGMQNPIKCYRNGEGDYIVNAGFRRMAAVHFINDNPDVFEHPIERVPVLMEDRYANESDRAIRQLLENSHREDATPIEKAKAYRKLLDVHGLDIDEVASRLGEKPATIKRFLTLLEAAQPIRKALTQGKIGMTAASDIVRKHKEDQKAQEKALELAVAAGGGRATAKATTAATRVRAPRQRTRSVVEVKAAIEECEVRMADAENYTSVTTPANKRTKAIREVESLSTAIGTLKWVLGAEGKVWG